MEDSGQSKPSVRQQKAHDTSGGRKSGAIHLLRPDAPAIFQRLLTFERLQTPENAEKPWLIPFPYEALALITSKTSIWICRGTDWL